MPPEGPAGPLLGRLVGGAPGLRCSRLVTGLAGAHHKIASPGACIKDSCLSAEHHLLARGKALKSWRQTHLLCWTVLFYTDLRIAWSVLPSSSFWPVSGCLCRVGRLRAGMMFLYLTPGYILRIGFWARPLVADKTIRG